MTVLTIRSSKRFAVRQPVLVNCPNGTQSTGLLIELSQEGGRVSGLGSVDLAMGDAIVVEVEGHALPSLVRWTRAGVMGVRFTKALYGAQLSTLLSRPQMVDRSSVGRVAA